MELSSHARSGTVVVFSQSGHPNVFLLALKRITQCNASFRGKTSLSSYDFVFGIFYCSWWIEEATRCLFWFRQQGVSKGLNCCRPLAFASLTDRVKPGAQGSRGDGGRCMCAFWSAVSREGNGVCFTATMIDMVCCAL